MRRFDYPNSHYAWEMAKQMRKQGLKPYVIQSSVFVK